MATASVVQEQRARNMAEAVPVTIARGDGIGPEIMDATLRIMDAAGARLAPQEIEIGERVYRRGITSGIGESAWDSLIQTKVFLKAPITTPQGGGYKSLNVTIRKALGLFANVRPCVAYAPYVATRHPGMDVVIVRENEEDLYGGIEHQQTDEVVQCLKLISAPGCEKIVRYAFEYARATGRKKVTCFTKDNIMKLTDGLFHWSFDRIAKQYPELEAEHMIVDIGAAMLVDKPERFDVLVMPNLYGDILSDIAAQMTGSVGLAGSANIGEFGAMFEAIHGSAPALARGEANPSALLNAAVLMLQHIGQGAEAARIKNAWLKTLEDGTHTRDIAGSATVKTVTTGEFADAVIANLGEEPSHLPKATVSSYAALPAPAKYERQQKVRHKKLVGVDVFVQDGQHTPEELAQLLQRAETAGARLQMVTNRGVKVWPHGLAQTFCTDHWRCRFVGEEGMRAQDVVVLLFSLYNSGIEVVKTENLYTFDGKPGFSLGQGQ